jgi:hypothetical protein
LSETVDVKQQETTGMPHRWKVGETGNPNGRPRKPEVELLREALETAKTKHGKHLIEHAIELAYKDNNVLIAILRKILPDQLEGKGFDQLIKNVIVFRNPEAVREDTELQARQVHL